MAAIFGTDTEDVIAPADPRVDHPFPDVADDPAEQPGDLGQALPLASWPIIEGTEHFSIWVESADSPWPEFRPGVHYDIRQPSRLRNLLASDRIVSEKIF
jgi:hypothetical protein